MTSSDISKVVAYGDSQTAGFSWGPRMVALSDTLTEAIGRGMSGQEAGTIAVREGGIVLKTTAAVTIPASTETVMVPLQASVTPCNIRASSSVMPMVLAGVRGTLTISTSSSVTAYARSTGVGTGEFVPESAPSAAVEVPSGTAFVSQDVADHPEYGKYLHIIWAGGNDSAFAGATRITGLVSAVQAIVTRLKTQVDEPRFLVAARTCPSTEVEGTTGHATAVAQRDALAAAFPDNAIDIWGHVRDNGMTILGLEPTADDLTAIAGKSMPPSLTSDGTHYSTATREQVLAPFLVSEIASRGWGAEPIEEVPTVAFTPKTDWKSGDEYSAARMIELEAAAAAGEAGAAVATTANETAAAAAQSAADAKTLANEKLPYISGNLVTYVNDSTGTFKTMPLGKDTATVNSIAMRTTGGVLVIADGTADKHAASVGQLNTAIAAQAELITALTNRVAALEAK